MKWREEIETRTLWLERGGWGKGAVGVVKLIREVC